MRTRLLLLAAMLTAGCITQPAAQPTMPAVIIPPPGAGTCAALAFDAPITFDQPVIDLSRATRGPAAFVGYEDNSINYYDIISDNRETNDYNDRFVRDTLTERVGTSRR